MDVLIRKAQPGDAEQLIRFVQNLAQEPQISIGMSPGEFNPTVEQEQKFLADCAASDNSVYLVAGTGGQIVGILNCNGGRRRAMRHAVSLGMSVDKDWRNKGIGSLLMADAIEWAKRTGVVSRIELNVFVRNEMAIHLYQKFGFVVEGRRRKALFREGQYHDDLIMALVL